MFHTIEYKGHYIQISYANGDEIIEVNLDRTRRFHSLRAAKTAITRYINQVNILRKYATKCA